MIRNGASLTKAEQRAYRLEFARQKFGYRSAEESLETEADCLWVDLSFVTYSRGREVYVLEMGEAITTDDDDLDGSFIVMRKSGSGRMGRSQLLAPSRHRKPLNSGWLKTVPTVKWTEATLPQWVTIDADPNWICPFVMVDL